MEKTNFLRCTVNFVTFAFVFWIYQNISQLVPSTKRGFYCEDPALALPYKTNGTIANKWIAVTIYSAPAIIWLVELAINVTDIRNKFNAITWRSVLWFRNYYFVFMCLIIFMSTVKNLVGSLRPFFFEVCQPDLGENCTTGSYISHDYKCTNKATTEFLHFETRRSFPSGHVVVSVYSCFVLMWYLQSRLSKTPFLLTAAYLFCSLWIFTCSISRVTDHWHHWIDVVGGFLMTLPFVFYTSHILCKSFVPAKERVETPAEQQENISL